MSNMENINTTRLSDQLDGDGNDKKGCTQGGVHRTAEHLQGERCRQSSTSIGTTEHALRRAPTNLLVERGVECGPAQQTSAALKVVPVANPTGNSSTLIYFIWLSPVVLIPRTGLKAHTKNSRIE